ncbi:MAG: dephospho-CoA kinase [Planctomycetaceae bacterium]|nr:dephospho-CoA kinase [Planctomycetaceae bacterium]MCB9937837.1 dephospho-CoA kinase [Planctomycetaceae bacterium]
MAATSEREMKIVGILGGVASGKSLVAEELRKLGARVLDADQVGHQVLLEPEVIQAARDRWGDAVITEAGQINRSEVAKIVFAQTPDGPKELSFLEQLTHPRIGMRLRQEFEAIRAGGSTKVVILDAPVMLKAGWDKYCDYILFIDVPRDMRLQRARVRGWTDRDFEARESSQESLETKRAAANHVIDNSGSIESTRQQIERFWGSLD